MRCVRSAGPGSAHTHRGGQLCGLLPGAEADRGQGAQEGCKHQAYGGGGRGSKSKTLRNVPKIT